MQIQNNFNSQQVLPPPKKINFGSTQCIEEVYNFLYHSGVEKGGNFLKTTNGRIRGFVENPKVLLPEISDNNLNLTNLLKTGCFFSEEQSQELGQLLGNEVKDVFLNSKDLSEYLGKLDNIFYNYIAQENIARQAGNTVDKKVLLLKISQEANLFQTVKDFIENGKKISKENFDKLMTGYNRISSEITRKSKTEKNQDYTDLYRQLCEEKEKILSIII